MVLNKLDHAILGQWLGQALITFAGIFDSLKILDHVCGGGDERAELAELLPENAGVGDGEEDKLLCFLSTAPTSETVGLVKGAGT